MKKVLLSIGLVISIIFFGQMSVAANAAPVIVAVENPSENEDQVEPNRYEKRKIEINTRTPEQFIEKDRLPEEQMDLTFVRQPYTEAQLLQHQLFQSTTIETNTITTKSDQLQLFSSSDQQMKQRENEEELPTSQSRTIMILFSVIVILLITTIFIFVLPKLSSENK